MTDDTFPSFDLSCLTERQREVIEMHYGAGLSFREIGRLLGISHVTVVGHHIAAIARLRGEHPTTSHKG